MRRFAYHSPETVDEAINLLEQKKGKAELIAGGTDLLVNAKKELHDLKNVVDISSIEDMQGIEKSGDEIHIGAATRISEIADSPLVQEEIAVLAQAARQIGSRQIRNMATIGGNIGNAAPSADTAPPLLVLKTEAVIAGPDAERKVPICDVFTGPCETALGAEELIKKFIIPCPSANTACCYHKNMRRKAMDVAVAGTAVSLTVDEEEVVQEASVALGAVAPTPLLIEEINEMLAGNQLTFEKAQEAARAARKKAKPVDDVRGSKYYRNRMVETQVKNALLETYSQLT